MFKLTELVTKYPKRTLVVLFLVTLAFGYFMTKVQTDTSVGVLVPDDHPAVQYFVDMREIFGSSFDMVLVGIVNEEGIFNTDTLRRIKGITDAIGEISGVNEDEIIGIYTVDEIIGGDLHEGHRVAGTGARPKNFSPRKPQFGPDLGRLDKRLQ